MKWEELIRAEKIAHWFDYPYPERLEKVKELWGADASEYAKMVDFPRNTSWDEIVAVIKQTGKKQYAYVTLKVGDFGVITNDNILNNCNHALALIGWHKKVMNQGQPIQFGFELYDGKTLICHVCTRRAIVTMKMILV